MFFRFSPVVVSCFIEMFNKESFSEFLNLNYGYLSVTLLLLF